MMTFTFFRPSLWIIPLFILLNSCGNDSTITTETTNTDSSTNATDAVNSTSCVASDNEASILSAPNCYQLVLNEGFDAGIQPDSSIWTYDIGSTLIGGSVWGNNENQHYTSSTQNVFLNNGSLVIQARHETPADASAGVFATSGRVISATSGYYALIGSEPYGFYEIRAKIACTAGSWPALWMLGRDGDWPLRGEIDIMEWFGRYYANEPNQLTSALHTEDRHGGSPISQNYAVANLCDQFHDFQLHWTENRITIGVDGTTQFTHDKPNNATQAAWPFTQPAHLLFNVAVGGNLGGTVNDPATTIPNMRMEIDHVKIWQASTSNGSVSTTSANSYRLFASQSTQTGKATNSAGITLEGGNIWGFNDDTDIPGGNPNGFTYDNFTLSGAANAIRQAFGYQFRHHTDEPVNQDSDFFGYAIKAPNNASMDARDADYLILQVGNGSDRNSNPNSHEVFTLDLNSLPTGNTCSYDLNLAADARPSADASSDQNAGVNAWGLRTYRIALNDFSCSAGSLALLKANIGELVIKIVGGKDADTSALRDARIQTLLTLGYVGFTSDSQPIAGLPLSNLLFASQVTASDGSFVTLEGGNVTPFNDGTYFTEAAWDFGNSASEQNQNIQQRLSLGHQRAHAAAVNDATAYFGLTYNAPLNGSFNVSTAASMVIQVGNAWEGSSDTAHRIFTLEVSDGNAACEYDLTLEAVGKNGNDYGLRTYKIPLEGNFSNCRNGGLEDALDNLNTVSIKVVGGKDATVDAQTGAGALIQVGYIAFSD